MKIRNPFFIKVNLKIISLFLLFLSLILINQGIHFTVISIFTVFIALYIMKLNIIKITAFYFVLLFFILFWGTYILSRYDLDIKMYVATSLYILIIFLFWGIIKNYKNNEIVLSLRYIIIFLFAIILIQQLIFFLLKYYIDFHNIITFGIYESRNNDPLIQKIGLTRATTFFIEPSNYSAIMSYLTLLYYFYSKRIDKYFYLGIFSSMLSFSYAAILINILIVISTIILKNKLSYKAIYGIFISALLLLSLVTIVYTRINSDIQYDVVSSRIAIFNIISSFDYLQYMFGNGILTFEEPIIINNISVTNSMIRDTGLWINIFFSTGFLGILIVLYFFKRIIGINLNLLLIILVFNFKMDYLQPILWIFIIGIIYAKKDK